MAETKRIRVAIVTGAASGIGRAAAQCLADAGNTVVLADIRESEGTTAAETIGQGAVYRYLDVSDEQGWLDLIAWAKAELGGFDILVNNAATFTFGAIDSVTYEDWLHTFKVNAGGPFLGCKHAVREMKGTGGVIVNVSSNSTILGINNVPIYSTSKATVNTLTRSIAAYVRKHHLPIRCNTIVPAGTVSDSLRSYFLDSLDIDILSGTPEAEEILKQFTPAEHVGAAIAMLCSDQAVGVNGAELLADEAQTLTMLV